jgi:NNP family nitrate/nitrite transporter-like MFS transporter
VGATVRIPYSFAVSRFGGRNWTTISAALLLIPVVLFTFIVTNPATPFWVFLLGGAAAGLGGGNFASSMANISYFYPDRRKGLALGVNAAGGNLGVAISLLVAPMVIGWGWLAVTGGGEGLFLQNVGLIMIPFIVAAAVCAWLFMDNLKVSRASVGSQMRVLKRKQTWLISFLYIGTFGSFIGFSSGLPLLMKTQFPGVALSLAFLGPLVGSLSRPFGGWLSDRQGGAKVTLWTFGAMFAATLGVAFFIERRLESYAFAGFLTMFVVLFLLTGIGNGSIYRLIPTVFRDLHLGRARGAGSEDAALSAARVETAAAVGLIGAIGAYGGWLFPQSFGVSTSLTGSPLTAVYLLAAFYAACLGTTWWNYLRRSPEVAAFPGLVEEELGMVDRGTRELVGE